MCCFVKIDLIDFCKNYQVMNIKNNNNNNNNNNKYNSKNRKFKILIIGNHTTGKSSLLRQYVDNCFEGELWHGVEVKTKEIIIKNQNKTQLIFDFNGGCRFQEITKTYFKKSHGIIIVYSLSDLESYNSISYWINEIKKYTIYSNNDNSNGGGGVIGIDDDNDDLTNYKPPKILIVGNKSDLPDSQKVVDPDKAKEFCDLLSIPSIHNVSAKCTTNVQEVFYMISSLIESNLSSLPQQSSSSSTSSLPQQSSSSLNIKCGCTIN